ncbi:MAG: rhodanese-like domain-containing protein [Candidatus Hodarchaeales archaeon]|jgi:rhodanese-related sulfurtransferase
MKTRLVFLIFFINIFVMNSNLVTGEPVDEIGLIEFLNNNPDVIIIDIRWQEVYEQGHLADAYLIDSSLTDEQIQTRTMEIINSRGANSSTAIGMYCNCGDGSEAAKLESYLISQGYTNTVWLTTSFSLWQDESFIITGPNRVTIRSYSSEINSSKSSPSITTTNMTLLVFFLPLVTLYLRKK